MQVVTGSQGEGPAEEVTLLGWAEVLASHPGPRLLPGRRLPALLMTLSLLSYCLELGRASPSTGRLGPMGAASLCL